MTHSGSSNTALLAALTITVLIGFFSYAPATTPDAYAKSPEYYRELKLFSDVMRLVKKNYVKEVADKELIQGAINGMLQSLDPHSSFLNEESFKELQVETKGEFPGLGIEITLDNGILTIVSPIEDTPAFKAGLQPGDKIIKIDGETTKNITLLKAVKKMRGPKGTKVTLTIMRDGFRKFQDFVIVRDVIHVRSVKKEQLEPGFPYIRVVSFQESTDTDLVAAIKEMGGDDGIKGLILDLRNNPGGLLEQAVKVSNLFIEEGVIVQTDGRQKDQRQKFWANKSGEHYNFKMAVLINEGSASASEIVAGAMQDYDRALIVGVKSFGKASVQTIIPLENGAGLRLTTAHYYTPLHRLIQKTGIEPDVDLKKEIEKQMEDEAREEAKKNGDKKKKTVYPRPKVDPQKDLVVKKALEWLKSTETVKGYKEAHPAQPSQDTAFNDDM
jgi:carboxyl-terminal processing protease